jgi:molecular chaperone DnaK
MGRIIWIDLGTTNSAFAYTLNDKPEIIPNAEGERTTPSVVYIKGDEIIVWTIAKRKAVLNPKNTIYEVKRFIGRKYDEAIDDVKRVAYDVEKWPDGGVLIKIDGKTYKPEQISAMILQKIKKDAESFLGETVDRAVITVPAHFNDSQRQATIAAGEIAGLKVERIINEPTAASLAYGLGKWQKKDEIVAVYDFWGGTFDVTILQIGEEGTFQVLSTAGDTHLWGADIDNILIDYLLKKIKEKEGIDLKDNPTAMARLKEEAEKAKKQLSSAEVVDIQIPYLAVKEDGTPINLEETLTRAQFESMIEPIIDKTVPPMRQAIQDAGVSLDEVNEIILVGGSTRIPLVKKKIKEVFGKEPKATVNPDEAVALGAAVQGNIISGGNEDIVLLDVTPLSLGVEVEGGMVDVVVPRNTTIPYKKTKIYTTAQDNQQAVTIHVVQGERPMAADNKSLGMFNLEGIPPMRRGEPQIEVTFDIDANGVLNVSAREKTTGKEQKVTIQGATNLSEEEIERMKQEAEKHAEEDRKRKEVAEKKNQYDAIVYQMEKLINEKPDAFTDEEKNKVKEYVEDAKKVREDQAISAEDVQKKIDEVQKFAQQIAQKAAQAGNACLLYTSPSPRD